VLIDRVDLAGVSADRDQLWGEAAIAEAQGEALVIPEALWSDAAVQQSARMEVDPWEDIITTKLVGMAENILRHPGSSGFAGKLVWANTATGSREWRVSSAFLLSEVLSVTTDRQHQALWTRLANVMTSLGWTHSPAPIRIGTGFVGRGFTISAEAEE
jgi:predicted P-loop ATPase